MKRNKSKSGWTRVLAMTALCAWLGAAAQVSAQTMSDYTNMPLFINKSAPPNILFLVDIGNATLEAAYAQPNFYYPISFKAAVNTLVGSVPYYASNVNVDTATASGGGADDTDLRALDLSNNVLAATPAAPADIFNPATKYYGLFNPERCYTSNGTIFVYQWKKVNGSGNADFTVACNATTGWDGNLLNWLTMRKEEIIYKVLVGGSGHTTPAQANQDGTANSLAGESKTGENGAPGGCSKSGSTWNACWRYVKFVPAATLINRVPSALPAPAVNLAVGGPLPGATGRFFGIGEGQIYVNDNGTVSPFDSASGNQYAIKIDLLSEPNVPAGTGSYAGTCDPVDPAYAGARICYQRDQALGVFQALENGGTGAHVAIMFVNASTGQGGSLFFAFEDTPNSNVYAQLRNEATFASSPLAESLYEALCLYNKQNGPCYSNSGSWKTGYDNAVGVAGDPFYFTAYNKMISCCKSYVLMISPGIGVADGNNPDLVTPFPLNQTMTPTTNLGVVTTAAAGDRLDDVAFYGRTHDIRAGLTGTQNVTFYAVNAMGKKDGATLLASAAKYGGFEDKNKNGMVDLTGQTCTYPSGSNLGSGSGTSNQEWDGGPNPDCVPDTFFDASDGYGLIAQIQAAINDIMKKSSSGTSISVLASSSTGEGSIYQAFFYPETVEDNRTVSWTGYLQGIFIDTYGNLREDKGDSSGGPDGKLVYTDDTIIVTELDTVSGDVVVRHYDDGDGDGKADDPGYYTVPRTGGTISTLREMQGLWEAGKKLTMRDLATKPRNLFTWVDLNDDGVVTSNEQIPFTAANAATLAPYLRATSTGTYTATNIINFLQGNQPTNMRERQLTVDGQLRVWRLGDIVNSSPTIVGPPRERFDILYGDSGYRQYLQRWANRRQVAYVGANDGMMHAFNVGYYHRGDNPNTNPVEHGWYSDNADGTNVGSTVPTTLGDELWGFVPHYVLPQLVWYTDPGYAHISYVDLKPKVTDVRIFTAEPACGSLATPTPTATGCIHPDGWGTIMIVGMRYGGSCGICTGQVGGTGGGPPMAVTADFGSGTATTRVFYSGYVVLDITNPDATPTVLSAFSNYGLGLTTTYPTVVRMSPKGDGKNDHTNARWMMLLGSGQHGYDGRAAMYASMFGVLLGQQGTAPGYVQMPILDKVSSPQTYKSSFMGDLVTFDRDLDFRSDAVYGGRTISGSSQCGDLVTVSACGTGLGYWTGKAYRLTMGTCTTAPCSVLNWGVTDSGWLLPTEMVTAVPIGGTPVPLGPVTAGSGVTLDTASNTWVFFGTGRFLSTVDKTDQHAQYLVGVKDSVTTGTCTQTSLSSCKDETLLEVTNGTICVSCSSGSQVQGVGTITTFSDLVNKTQTSPQNGGASGWVIKLSTNAGSTTLGAERSIVNPTMIGGAVFFPTFTPSSDVCVATGTSQIYGLYYMTGTGYTDPIFGVDANGKAIRSIDGGQGVASSVAIQIGAEPTGMAGYFQSSNSSITKVSPKVPAVLWSQFMAWVDQRI